jgi:hypothetical protein
MSQEEIKKPEEDRGVGHHGPPILTPRDVILCQAMSEWIATARQWGGSHYKDWTPSFPDITKSRLFWRIRSGKKPLPEPPPTCYSCPWYEVVEEDRPHWTSECYVSGNKVNLAQCSYEIVQTVQEHPDQPPTPTVVRFRSLTYRIWANKLDPFAPPDTSNKFPTEGWFIQRIVE